MDIQDPNELLKPIATIIIDTAIAASALYTGLGNLLVPNPEGIYVRSRDWPIVTPEMTLFDTKGKRVNYSEIGELNEELRDIDGRTVFSSEIMKNKGMHLRLNGFYSVSAQALVRISIITQLKALCQYTAVSCNESPYDYILPGYSHAWDEGWFDVYTEEIMKSISDFVGEDVWNIYFIDKLPQTLIIKKSVDNRIYEWTKDRYQSE